MAWEYVNFEYPVPNLFEKHLVWLSANCNMYFAMKLNKGDNWTYYAGNGSHALLSGKILTSYGSSEANAQTNYLTTTKDSGNKVLAILPTVVQARYIRMYIESGSSITVYEYRPSTRVTAHDIVTGNLEITDELNESPKIVVTKSSVDRVIVGNISGSTYGIAGYDGAAATIFELSDANQTIAGLDITDTLLQNGNAIVIDSNSKKISINSTTYGNEGIQLDYNSSTPRAYIGDGNNQYFKYDGANTSWKGTNTELSAAGKLSVSNIECDGGTVGGWNISATKIESDSIGSKISLNKSKNRISIFNSGLEKTTMGYLNGLPTNASPSQTWGENDYGFYAAPGDHLKIDGNASYVSGDWIIEHDAAYKVNDGSNNTIIKMGTDSGKKGMFVYNTSGTQLAEYTGDSILVGNVSSSQYMQYTIADGAKFRGGLNADDITVGAINASVISANTITATMIDVNELSAITASVGTVTAGKIQSSNYNASDAGMEIDLDNAKMTVYEASGLVIESNGGILMYTASDIDPSYINTIDENGSLAYLMHGSGKSTFFGENAGNSQNNTGIFHNVGIGKDALYNNTIGAINIGIGLRPLYNNINGAQNIGVGYYSLYNNTAGDYNTAIGYRSMYMNASGNYNISIGYDSLYKNTEGEFNIAIGYFAMNSNTTGGVNIGVGYQALYKNTTGIHNVGVGRGILFDNVSGDYNTAIGAYANYNGSSEQSGGVYLGYRAGYNEKNSSRLYISNSSTSSPLIYGEFDNKLVKINDDLEVIGSLTLTNTIDEFSTDGTLSGDSDTAVPTEKAVKTYVDANDTGLPRGYIAGLQISNNAADSDNDIDIAVGECRDSTNSCDLILTSGLTKQLNATFAAGTDAGGLFSGSVANLTWYHVFLIKKDSDGTIDAGFDTDVDAANIPTGYTEYRRIGSVRTDSFGADIYAFTQIGDAFLWANPLESVDEAGVDQTTAALKTLHTPPGVKTKAMINVRYGDNSHGRVYLSCPDANDEAASFSSAPLSSIAMQNSGENVVANMEVYTNTSSQIRVRGDQSNVDHFDITTLGWTDRRGRDD